MTTNLTLSVSGNRAELRSQVINQFLKETPGTGTGDLASKYRYHVETASDLKEIILLRPARFNNGFDFTIHVENESFEGAKPNRRTSRPRHDNILDDLALKKSVLGSDYSKISAGITSIYNCEAFDYSQLTRIDKPNSGYPSDLILKVIKWLFIEQDVTYWHYSGRGMFYSKIKSSGL